MTCPYYFWSEIPLTWASCTGLNAKRTLILSSGPDSSENLPLLKKILHAIEFDFEKDIHFLSTPENLQTQLLSDPHLPAYQNLILFGMKPSQIGILSDDTGGCRVFYFENLICIIAPALRDIETQPQYKKDLWARLKQVFQTAS